MSIYTTAALVVAAYRFLERNELTDEERVIGRLIKRKVSLKMYLEATEIIQDLANSDGPPAPELTN